MTDTVLTLNNRAVVITAQSGKFAARLYVNARSGLAHASATPVSATFKSLAGAQRWADRKLAA